MGSDSEDEPNKKKRRLSDEYQSSESEENNIDERQPSEKHSIYGNYLSCPRGIRNGLSESQHSDAESYISDTLPFPDREYEKIVISTNHSREFIVSDTESEGEEMDFNGNDLADSSGSTVKTPTWPNEREKSDDVDESPRVDICLKLKNSPSKVIEIVFIV